jgi:hypothetical protein
MSRPSDDDFEFHRADAQELHGGYFYRRRLKQQELAPAVGVGVAVGLLAYYVVRILTQRTPLAPEARSGRQRLRPIVRSVDAIDG